MFVRWIVLVSLAWAPMSQANPAESVAESLEVVGILGDHNAGTDFNGIVVLKLAGGQPAFLRLNDPVPGYPNVSLVKVEKKRVYIGSDKNNAVPLTWQSVTLAERDRGGMTRPSLDYQDDRDLIEPPPPADYNPGQDDRLHQPQVRRRGYSNADGVNHPDQGGYDNDYDAPPPPPPPARYEAPRRFRRNGNGDIRAE